MIRKFTKADLKKATQLYLDYMPDSFFKFFDKDFIELLLKSIISSKYGDSFVYAAPDGIVAGFIAATSDKKKLFQEIFARDWMKICGFALTCLLRNPAVAFPILETIRYCLRNGSSATNPAELLFVAVAPTHRKRGVCGSLIKSVFAQFIRQGISEVKVCVLNKNFDINRLLRGMGFKQESALKLYGKDMLLYRISLTDDTVIPKAD